MSTALSCNNNAHFGRIYCLFPNNTGYTFFKGPVSKLGDYMIVYDMFLYHGIKTEVLDELIST